MGLDLPLNLVRPNGRLEQMSVTENAGRLISHSTEYIQSGIAVSSMSADALNQAIQKLMQIGIITSESVSRASDLLGSGHPSVAAIAGVAESVHSKVAEVQATVESAINQLIDMDQVMNTYASTVGAVGQVLLQGGS